MQKSSMKINNNSLKSAILVLGIVLFALFISRYYYQVMIIHGDSMEPAYHSGEFVFLDKRIKNIETRDVIAFNCTELNEVLVKRVVAGPKDNVLIRAGRLYVNGAIFEEYQDKHFSYSGILGERVELSDNQYIVIGDNIESSKDSRYPEIGVIDLEDVIGVVIK